MRRTVKETVRLASNLISHLMASENLDRLIEVDENFNYRNVVGGPQPLFEAVESDIFCNEGDLIFFDYVDLEGAFSSRVGYVMDPDAHSLHGWAILLYDLDVAEPRKFICERMSNVYWLVPTDR